MSNPRQAKISVIYSGKNISAQIKEFMKDYSYTDAASGESDSISIGLHDIDKRWMGEWLPSKGDRIDGMIILQNWNKDNTTDSLYCGNFELDDLSFSGRPLQCSIGAVSIPQNEPFNTQARTKTWEKVNVQQIATEIAARAYVALYYEADAIQIDIIEQNNQTDCKFLYSVCQSYGLAMKVYANRIVIFDEEIYEKKQAVAVIDESSMISWSYNTTVAGTYTGAAVSFSDPNNEKEYVIDIGNGSRILEVNETSDNIKDAERKGIAKLNNENKKAITMSVTIKANLAIVAGTCVSITGLKSIDGKYYVDKVKTKITSNGACQMALTLRMVVERIKSVSVRAAEAAVEEAAAEGTHYTIVSGDTLWGIAKTHLGSGVRYIEIYEINKEIIEAKAKSRGKKNSSNGHWIFPGTTITIPAREGI